MELYSVVKKDKIMIFAGKWIEPETGMPSEVTQTQKNKGYMFFLICGS